MKTAQHNPFCLCAAIIMLSALSCSEYYEVNLVLLCPNKSAPSRRGQEIRSDQIDCMWIGYCLEEPDDSDDSSDECGTGESVRFEDQYQFIREEGDRRTGPGPQLLINMPPDETITILVAVTYRSPDGTGSELGSGFVRNVEISDLPEEDGVSQLIIQTTTCNSPEQCWDRCPLP